MRTDRVLRRFIPYLRCLRQKGSKSSRPGLTKRKGQCCARHTNMNRANRDGRCVHKIKAQNLDDIKAWRNALELGLDDEDCARPPKHCYFR